MDKPLTHEHHTFLKEVQMGTPPSTTNPGIAQSLRMRGYVLRKGASYSLTLNGIRALEELAMKGNKQ
jgi:hypothetical protein